METIRVLEEIEKSRGYDIALATTFNFDVDFFERVLLGKLYVNGIRNISLFIDAQELNRSIAETTKRSLLVGKKYSVNPVNLKGAFHPKVLLLLNQDRAKLFVASANLTRSSYMNNNEIFNVFEVDKKHDEHLDLIQQAAEFFLSVYDISYPLDDDIIAQVRNLPILKVKPAISKDKPRLIHNLESPIVEQLKQFIANVKSIDVAVPFYDNELTALSAIHEAFPEASVNTYVQNNKSRFNLSRSEDLPYMNVNGFTGFLKPKSNSFYHGKVLRFKSDDASWILYGSSNCTQSAICKTPKSEGNVECDILESGHVEEFEYFFENMVLIESKSELSCSLLDYSGDIKNGWCFYKYGTVANEFELHLHIGVNGDREIKAIKMNDILINWNQEDKGKGICCIVPISDVPNDTDLIEISIISDDSEETLRCWVINYIALDLYRRAEFESREFKYAHDSTGDEYCEDQERLIRHLTACYEDLDYKNGIINLFESRHKEDDIDYDDEDSPEGIVDYIIPARIPSAEETVQYKNIKKAQAIGHRFLYSYTHPDYDYQSRPSSKGTADEQKPVLLREPTTAEQTHKSFVRNTVRDMQNEQFLNKVTVDHYLSLLCVLCEDLNKHADHKIKGMFDLEYIVKTRCDLLQDLLNTGKILSDDNIRTIIQIALETYYLDSRRGIGYDKWKLKITSMIKEIAEKYSIRNSDYLFVDAETSVAIGNHIAEYITIPEYVSKVSGVKPTVEELNSLIDAAIGYKNDSQIKYIIRKHVCDSAEVEIVNAKYIVRGEVESIRDWMQGNEWLLSEIEKYCIKKHEDVNTVRTEVLNLAMPDKGDPVQIIILEKKIGSTVINQHLIRRSGSQDSPVPIWTKYVNRR